MPVERFRSIAAMNAASQRPADHRDGAAFERFLRHCARYWRIAPKVYPRGVFRFRDIETAQAARAEITRSQAAP